jgi:hypothetical protein
MEASKRMGFWQHTEAALSTKSLAGIIVDEYKSLLRAKGVQEGETNIVRE